MNIDITITQGTHTLTRHFSVDSDQVINNDWGAEIGSMYDSLVSLDCENQQAAQADTITKIDWSKIDFDTLQKIDAEFRQKHYEALDKKAYETAIPSPAQGQALGRGEAPH